MERSFYVGHSYNNSKVSSPNLRWYSQRKSWRDSSCCELAVVCIHVKLSSPAHKFHDKSLRAAVKRASSTGFFLFYCSSISPSRRVGAKEGYSVSEGQKKREFRLRSNVDHNLTQRISGLPFLFFFPVSFYNWLHWWVSLRYACYIVITLSIEEPVLRAVLSSLIGLPSRWRPSPLKNEDTKREMWQLFSWSKYDFAIFMA